ncbi:hypothetical protein KKF64_02650 [Patescibacteria group bacterium]|nr:hypothetical protein [Patescibacteria group bacterium]
MSKTRNLFKEILDWTYKRQENGFIEEDLKKELKLTDKQFEWYLGTFRGSARRHENLINHLDYTGKNHFFFLTERGISKYFEYQKSWHEKASGKIFLALIIALISFLSGKFGGYLIAFIQNIKNQIIN